MKGPLPQDPQQNPAQISWSESRDWEPTEKGHGVEGNGPEPGLALEGHVGRAGWVSGL